MNRQSAEPGGVKAAVVDYGLGNLFSVRNACEYVGMVPAVTSSHREILAADVVILPGVGAFPDAMASLKKLDLVQPLREIAASDQPLFGICLGMQLMMTESQEFGWHQGLGLIEGSVVHLDGSEKPVGSTPASTPASTNEVALSMVKVPQVGWNRIFRTEDPESQPRREESSQDPWTGSALEGLKDGEYMYFVHSFYAKPKNPSVVLSTSEYGNVEFCSSLRYNNIFACQFHPERSGPRGLSIYRNIADSLASER